jgi:hypothetical protein
MSKPGKGLVTIVPRRVSYSDELAMAICEAVATTPRGIDWLCGHNPQFPNASTISRWIAENPDFRAAMQFAKRRQAELLMYQGLEIADDDSGDLETVERRDGTTETRMNSEFVARSKLRVDARFKMAARLDPKVWGDKLDIEASLGFTRQEDALEHLR